MRILIVFLSLTLLTQALLPIGAYRRAYRRLGVDSSNIPNSAIAKLSRSLEHASSEAEAREIHNQFVSSLRRQYRGTGIINVLWSISRVAYWISQWIYSAAKLTNSVNSPFIQWNKLVNNLQGGYSRQVQRFDGDFEQIERHLVNTVLREAAKYLTKSQYLQLKREFREKERRDQAQLREAFELTRKDGPKRRLHSNKTRKSGEA